MKKQILLIIGFLFSFSIFGQGFHEFDELIADTTIKQRITYQIPSKKNGSEIITIVEIDRKKKEIRSNKGLVAKYNDNWKATEIIGYVRDSIKHFVRNYQYDELGNCIKSEYFLSSEKDSFKTLKIYTITNFHYNSTGKNTGLEVIHFPHTDYTHSLFRSKVEYFFNRNGLVKKREHYETDQDSEQYYFWKKDRIRYLKNGNIKARFQKNLNTGTKYVTVYHYENDLIKKVDTHKNGIFERTKKYSYKNGLVKEERFENFTKGFNHTKKYEYKYK